MLPIMLDWTMEISPSFRALIPTYKPVLLRPTGMKDWRQMPTIISTALPKVALIKPPATDPTTAASCSVAKVRIEASGSMARKLSKKTTEAGHPHPEPMRPRGTQKRRTLVLLHRIVARRACRASLRRRSSGRYTSISGLRLAVSIRVVSVSSASSGEGRGGETSGDMAAS